MNRTTINPPRGSDRGATAVEYSMIVAFIAAVIVLVVTALGLDVLGLFNSVDFP